MNRELIHFLRLGLMRVRHRTSELHTTIVATAAADGAEAAGAMAAYKKETETLKILEDLILEQVPYENIDHSAR